MQNDLVSVIIPVYNGEKYIAETITSAYNQTYQPLEIIVVDDGSEDRTKEIVSSFKEVKYIFQENQGDGIARNTGIDAANGYYYAFMDADDLWEPNKLSLQIEFLNRNPHIGYVICYVKNFLEAGCPKPDYMTEYELDNVFPGYIPVALVIPRPTLEQVGKYNTDLYYANDSDWFFRAKDAGIQEGILEEVLVHRRIHKSNRSHHRGIETQQVKEMFQLVRASLHRKQNKQIK